MSVYLVKGKGWRYDSTVKGTRHTEAWFKTRRKALTAEVERRKELERPEITGKTPTDMDFFDLVNRRLDHVKNYNSERHYKDYVYLANRWTQRWGQMLCSEITEDMIRDFVAERSAISSHTANKEIRYLRATFNYGKKKKGWIDVNPTDRVEFFPNNGKKRKKYIPTPKVIDKVISFADLDTQDYLWVIRETMARVSEVNRLEWDDVHFEARFVTLYTRKKKGGNLTARDIPMTDRLYEVLEKRHEERDTSKPWVFWHRYWSRKDNEFKEGPYQDRKKFMKKLCKDAGVPYFRFHPLRHSGASVMDSNNVPIGSIQRILGHENRKTTEIYLHSIGDSERKAMELFGNFSGNSHTDSHTERKKELAEFITTA